MLSQPMMRDLAIENARIVDGGSLDHLRH